MAVGFFDTGFIQRQRLAALADAPPAPQSTFLDGLLRLAPWAIAIGVVWWLLRDARDRDADDTPRENPDVGDEAELHSLTYKERKRGESRAELFEHQFGEDGGPKPKLAVDKRGDLKIKRGRGRNRSAYRVRDSWIEN
jgi:hypothetical protein